jgi:hypothetical protein
VASLATVVTCLCNGFESLSVVYVHRNARGKCARRGVHCCRGCDSGGGLCGGKGTECVGGAEWIASVGAD